MSYFMTTCGPESLAISLEAASLIPISDTQDYLRNLQARLQADDGGFSYLVEDRETGTSTEFIVQFDHALDQPGGDLDRQPLVQIVRTLLSRAQIIRIWWANSNPFAAFELPTVQVSPASDIGSVLAAHYRRDICVRLVPASRAGVFDGDAPS